MPPHLAALYPVTPKYARGNAHLSKAMTVWLQEIIQTYGNGGMFSRLLYNGICDYYFDKVECYVSFRNYEGVQCDILHWVARSNGFTTWGHH